MLPDVQSCRISIKSRRLKKSRKRVPFSSLGKLHKKQRSETVKQAIVHIALVVRDYDEAIEFYTNKLHFTLVEDTYQP